MVTKLETLIKKADTGTSDSDIEQLISEMGLKFWSLPYYEDDDQDLAIVKGIDEDLLYAMGYTLGDLPGNIKNSTNEFCNAIVGEMLYAGNRTSINGLQHKASIYLAGYQAGLNA
ncbi:MAG: hypothetical protein JXA01_05805 [Dehalococcoidia bacterium]|nr:hypothetical protein [Dehalococcoidia bacterium]